MPLPHPGRFALGLAAARCLDCAKGREHIPQGPYIAFANHQSNLDAPLLFAALRDATVAPLAAVDYWRKNPAALAGFYLAGAIGVERNPAFGSDPLAGAKAALSRNQSIIIFPEGGRRPGSPYKSGLFRLAQAFPGIPLLPARIDGSDKALPRGGRWPKGRSCKVTFAAPIRLEPGETKAEFLAKAQAAVLAA